MKKVLCIISVLIAINVSAQKVKNKENKYYNKPLHFGIKAGTNLNKITGSQTNQKFQYGFHAGGFVQVKLAHKLHIVGEVLFSQQNIDSAKALYEVFDFIRFSEERATLKLSYIDVPLLISLGIDQIGAIKLQAGIQASLLMNKDATILQNGQQAFKSGFASGVVGVDMQLAAIKLGARYLWGLGTINNINANNLNTQSAQIYLGIGF